MLFNGGMDLGMELQCKAIFFLVLFQAIKLKQYCKFDVVMMNEPSGLLHGYLTDDRWSRLPPGTISAGPRESAETSVGLSLPHKRSLQKLAVVSIWTPFDFADSQAISNGGEHGKLWGCWIYHGILALVGMCVELVQFLFIQTVRAARMQRMRLRKFWRNAQDHASPNAVRALTWGNFVVKCAIVLSLCKLLWDLHVPKSNDYGVECGNTEGFYNISWNSVTLRPINQRAINDVTMRYVKCMNEVSANGTILFGGSRLVNAVSFFTRGWEIPVPAATAAGLGLNHSVGSSRSRLGLALRRDMTLMTSDVGAKPAVGCPQTRASQVSYAQSKRMFMTNICGT